jgi:RNA polymerase sigma-70 factor (ECF subfamily)
MASAGDGFSHLVDAHYEALYRYAYRLSGSAADAEDLTQEAFGKAFTRLTQLRERERAKAWLFRILRNLYLHRVRDEKRHKVVPLDAVGEISARGGTEPAEIEPEKLQDALNELEESFRTPLILFYFDEFSYRDIAEQMDLPIGTVMSRLARAKAYLREKLMPCSPESGGGAVEKTEDKAKVSEKTSEKKGRKEVSDAMP